MIKYQLPNLSVPIIIFMDTSAFNLNDFRNQYKNPYEENSNKYLRKNKARLELLSDVLSRTDNWTIISEVLKEFKKGKENTKLKSETTKCTQIAKAFKSLYKQRIKTLALINDEYKIADLNLTDELIEIIKKTSPIVEKRFRNNKGEQGEWKTDTKLITFALAYAYHDKTGIFSYDRGLLRTFADCSIRLGLEKRTYIFNQKTSLAISTNKYLKNIR